MLLALMADREGRNAGVGSLMEELHEVKAERDLLLNLVQQQSGAPAAPSSPTEVVVAEADAAVAAAPETSEAVAAPAAEPAAAAAAVAVAHRTEAKTAALDQAVGAASASGGAESAIKRHHCPGAQSDRRWQPELYQDGPHRPIPPHTATVHRNPKPESSRAKHPAA